MKTTAFGVLSYLISGKTQILEIDLPSISSVPLDLYSTDLNLTLYCKDIVGTIPTLRQFATLAISKTLIRHQVFKEYISREYPSQCRVRRNT